jgi:hypothetical protein
MANTRKQRRAVRDETTARQTAAVPVPEESLEDLAYQAAHQARLTYNRYEVLEARAVRLGRKAGLSWDALGRWLVVPGETLRRRYVDDPDLR